MTNGKPAASEPYEPLMGLIEPCIELPFDGLTEPVRNRWNSDSFIAWDSLTANHRRSFAQQHDVQHDPANEKENKYWFDLVNEIYHEELQQREWELSNAKGVPSEIATRNEKLNVSKRRLQSLGLLWSRPPFTIEDWDDLSDAKLEAILEQPQADTIPPAGRVAPVAEAVVRKKWTPERTAEVQEYRDAHGSTKTALKYGVNISLITRKTAKKTAKQKAANFTSGLGSRIVTR